MEGSTDSCWYLHLWIYKWTLLLGKEMDTESAGEVELPPPFYDCREEYDVKKQELDELFGRLDERTSNTWTLVEKIEKHLEKLNDSVLENTVSCGKSKTNYRNLWTVIGFVVIIAGTALGIAL